MFSKRFFIICIIFIIFITFIIVILFPKNKVKIIIGNSPVWVKIAQTSEEKKQGLSGIEKLKDNEGMLFVLDGKQKPVFWMKDMNFALDAVWIADGKVVDLIENIPAPLAETADSQIVRFQPKMAADMVLEISAGWIKEKKIKIGDEFYFDSI